MRVSGSHVAGLESQLSALSGRLLTFDDGPLGFFLQCDIVAAFAPADVDSDADGDYVDMTGYAGCLVVLFKAAGTAGDDPSIKIQQATTSAGGGVKDLQFRNLRMKLATSLAASAAQNWTRVTLNPTADLDLATPVDYTSDNKQGLFVVDVKATDLDSQNNYKYLQLSIEGDDIGNPHDACGLYILYGRTPSATPPNQID